MKRSILPVLLIITCLSFSLQSQTILSLADNMEIASNSDIKIQPGSYEMADSGQAGLIRIVNKSNITIDGDSVFVDGADFGGYMIYIENSSNITIKNFASVSRFYYAMSVKKSSGININDNNFSYNKKDTVGWIFIWTGPEEALGGGVLMNECTGGEIFGNTMIQQNDGVAMYNCNSFELHDNTLHWNCGFGIRMNYTDNCNIHNNDCSHVNRLTDPSDCAAILLIVSNNNIVEYNNLTYSGDGVFLGQYEHSEVPNNNYFAYNDCSYSPHNAIEATFADGNIYKYNKCNFSHYGFWLGYSFNSLVEGNEIIGNYNSGVAVDRGFNNTFVDNVIRANPYGFELWEGGIINLYGDQFSHDYNIHNNIIESNTWGIHARNTEHLVARDNQFIHNQTDLYLEGDCRNDTISDNIFKSPTFYFIQNMSADNIYALNNTYLPNDRELIQRKMRGAVSWLPFNDQGAKLLMYNPPCDMAEPPASWSIYAEPGMGARIDEVLEWDYEDKMVGEASIKMLTGRGWDVGLNYRPGGDSVALWNLSEEDTLSVWIKTIKQPSYGFQYFHVRVGNYDQGYYKYTAPTSYLNNANNRWRHYNIPLKGNSTWVREDVGNMDLGQTSYVEFHADTWDLGYTIWLDGLQFNDCTPTGIEIRPAIDQEGSICYPNPFSNETTIEYRLERRQKVQLAIFTMSGKQVAVLVDGPQASGQQQVRFDANSLPPGLYFYKLICDGGVETRKMLKIN